jgi:hypothetical protein
MIVALALAPAVALALALMCLAAALPAVWRHHEAPYTPDVPPADWLALEASLVPALPLPRVSRPYLGAPPVPRMRRAPRPRRALAPETAPATLRCPVWREPCL